MYATTVSADASDRDVEAGRKAADEELRRLAGTLSASGDRQAASTVDRARSHLDQAMANRQAHHGQAAGATGGHAAQDGGGAQPEGAAEP